jgi:hypothetical protein
MCNWHGTLVVQNVILFLAFAVSVVTLVFLIKYVRATKGIEREAGKQSEGLSKPVVALRCDVPSPSPPPLDAASGVSAEVRGGLLELINIGNGPVSVTSLPTSRLNIAWLFPWCRLPNRTSEKGEPISAV